MAVRYKGRNEGWSFSSLTLSIQVHDEDVVIPVAFLLFFFFFLNMPMVSQGSCT